MTYKILIVKNRFTKKTILDKYLNWFKLYTPIEIVTEEITTDFDVEPQEVSNGTFSGVICKNTFLPELRKIVPENKYHAVVFIYGNDLGGIRVGVCDGLGSQDYLYKDTSVIQLCKSDDGGKQLNHELFHSFFHKLRRNGINLNDPMDTYIGNNILDVDGVVDTNREMALQNLSNYWDKVCAFDIKSPAKAILIRQTVGEKQTLGTMIAIGDQVLVCKTLEPSDKIPAGTYNCEYTWSPKFSKMTYSVRVPNIDGIRIHSGNTYQDTEGCILLGDTLQDINKDGIPDVINSRTTIDKFETILGRNPFILVVI